MPDSLSSVGSRGMGSSVSLNDQSVDNFSTKAVFESDIMDEYHEEDHENDVLLASTISRPLSRSSVTSGLSMTATKDGVEGRRVQRYGIPQYSLNLLNSMSQLHSKNKKTFEEMDSPDGPPMTFRDRIKLLSTDRLSKTATEDSQINSTSLEVLQYERQDSFKPRELEESLLNNFNMSNFPRVNSELDSNISTVGDDASYLHDMKSLPSVLVGMDSDNE